MGKRRAAATTLDFKFGAAGRLFLSVQGAAFAGDYRSRDLTFTVNRVLPGNFGPAFTLVSPAAAASASGGISLTRAKFNLRFNCTDQSRRQLAAITGGSVGPDTFPFATPRRLIDAPGEYHLTKKISAFANIRNLTDEPEDFERRGPQTPAYAPFRQSDRYGALWIFGLRGNF